MAMTMADYDAGGNVDDIVRRLLPREILADVGIVVAAPPSSCAVTRRRGDDHAAVVMEDIAAHLIGILGLDAARERQRAPPPHLRHVHEQHHRAGMRNGNRAPVAVGGGHGGAARHAPPASCWNGTGPRVPRFEMAAAMNSHPPVRCHGVGTGVFLPRVEGYVQQNRASSTSPSFNNRTGAKPPRMQRRDAAVMDAMRQQQQLLQLRSMAAEMDRRQREAFAAAFQFHGCPAIAPPQQWTY